MDQSEERNDPLWKTLPVKNSKMAKITKAQRSNSDWGERPRSVLTLSLCPSKSRHIRKLFEIIIPCWFSKMLVCLKNQLMHEYGRLCSTLCSRLCLSASDDLVHMRWCTTNAWVCTWGNSRAILVFLINYYWLLLFFIKSLKKTYFINYFNFI